MFIPGNQLENETLHAGRQEFCRFPTLPRLSCSRLREIFIAMHANATVQLIEMCHGDWKDHSTPRWSNQSMNMYELCEWWADDWEISIQLLMNCVETCAIQKLHAKVTVTVFHTLAIRLVRPDLPMCGQKGWKTKSSMTHVVLHPWCVVRIGWYKRTAETHPKMTNIAKLYSWMMINMINVSLILCAQPTVAAFM